MFLLYTLLKYSPSNLRTFFFSYTPTSFRTTLFDSAGFQVFSAVTLKNAVFWEVTPCRSSVKQRFGVTCRLHLQGRKIRERGISVSRWFTQNLHGATSHNTAYFTL
jgi:hypothetical protein